MIATKAPDPGIHTVARSFDLCPRPLPHYFEPADLDPEIIRSLSVAMLGYGSQGRPHALNLQDSGVAVVVGAREGISAENARADGFQVAGVSEAVRQADLVAFALPDVQMAEIYGGSVAPHLREGQVLLFMHGFNIHFGFIEPPPNVDVVMVSPKGAGYGVRKLYEEGSGVPGLVAVGQDYSGRAQRIALSYAWALGCSRSVVLETTFKQETVSDLFGEQAVLCGGMIELIKAGFQTLVDAGYEPEAAYFECLHETKLIIDLLVAKGLHGLRKGISDTAEWGGYLAGPKVIGKESRQAMAELLQDIESGKFAKEWIEEAKRGAPELLRMREEEARSEIEKVGEELRGRINKP